MEEKKKEREEKKREMEEKFSRSAEKAREKEDWRMEREELLREQKVRDLRDSEERQKREERDSKREERDSKLFVLMAKMAQKSPSGSPVGSVTSLNSIENSHPQPLHVSVPEPFCLSPPRVLPNSFSHAHPSQSFPFPLLPTFSSDSRGPGQGPEPITIFPSLPSQLPSGGSFGSEWDARFDSEGISRSGHFGVEALGSRGPNPR